MRRRNGLGRLATLLLSVLLVFAVSCTSSSKTPPKKKGTATAKKDAGKKAAAKKAPAKKADDKGKKADGGKKMPAKKPDPMPKKGDEPKDPFAGEAGDLKVKLQRIIVAVDRAYEQGLTLYRQKRYKESVTTLNNAKEMLRWMVVQVPGQKGRLDRLNELIRKVEQDGKDFERQERLRIQDDLDRQRRIQELQASNRLRERIERLFREAHLAFRKEDFSLAHQLYKEILRLDPTNEDARKLAEVANLSYHRKVTDQSRRELIEQWLKLTEYTDLASLPMTILVEFPNEDVWTEIRKRQPRESGAEPENVEDSETAAIRERLRRKVTLDFSDTPLQDVVQFLRETTGVNMVLDPQVVSERGEDELKVQLRVEQLEVESALKLILELKQLGYQIRNGVVFITSKDNLSGNSETRVYNVRDLTLKIQDFSGPELSLSSATTSGGGTTIDTGVDDETGLTADALATLIRENISPSTWEENNDIKIRNGMLIIRNSPEVHGRIRSLLNDLRASVGLLVSVETRFLQVTDEFLTDIGVQWRGVGSPEGYGLTPPVPNDAPNFIAPDATLELDDVIFGPAGTGAAPGLSNGAVINGTDAYPGFFSANNRQNTRGRVEPLLDSFATALGPTSTLLPSPLNAPASGLDLSWSIIDRVSAQVILNAVQKSDRMTSVVAPRVTAFNTQRANVSVLRQQTYIKDFDVEVAENAAIGDPEIATIQDGVVLDVRPVVSADRKYVTLELRPTLAEVTITTVTSSIASGTAAIGSGSGTGTGNVTSTTIITIDTPNVELKELRTTVTMPDGGLVLVGGVTQYQQFTEESGVPILSDIPIITFFFSRQRKNRLRSNLLILVKADILALEEYEPRTDVASAVR